MNVGELKMRETMRAVCVTAPGGAENLEVREIARPVATADQVLVRVKAAGVNRADILQRMGRYPAPPGAPSNISALDFRRASPPARLSRASQR